MDQNSDIFNDIKPIYQTTNTIDVDELAKMITFIELVENNENDNAIDFLVDEQEV